MVKIEQVDTNNARQVNEFVQFQYDLYKGVPQFCPPFFNDIKLMLNRKKHPFFEHSEADFFVARDETGKMLGRIAVMENKPFNEYHKTKKVQFYLFDCVDDQDVAKALFDKAADWAKGRGLNEIVGPKGFSAFDGYGILVEGFEHHQMMTMMNYNFPYYGKLLEAEGFSKEVDFVSCYMASENFRIPEKAKEISKIVQKRGTFNVVTFKNRKDMMKRAWDLGMAYNDTFVNNWEYYPLTKGEVQLLLDNLLVVADPKLIKLIEHEGKIVGFLLAFPDITSALQRHGGKITPWGMLDMLRELKKTKWVSVNGAGVLPEFHGRGGNALLYDEMEKTIREFGFEHAEFTQVAETAVQMRKDLINLGGQPYKNHRIFHKTLD
jgi:GNAT superfamily N-acetyltransferase